MSTAFRFDERACGILLHPTSLPGPHGSGDIGPEARAFVDFLQAAGQRWWQMLPIGPPGPGNSPYSPFSAFAASPWLISLADLADEGLLPEASLKPPRSGKPDKVNFKTAMRYRHKALRAAFAEFAAGRGVRSAAFRKYVTEQQHWLYDYALFAALKRTYEDVSWLEWPVGLRRRHKSALKQAREDLADELLFEQFCQYTLDRQWQRLREYARQRGVGLIGDIPIFVAHDSADVWSRPELFRLKANGRAEVVTGVPPDYFSRTGQLWGHPHYDWPRHKRGGFRWWIARFERLVNQFDGARIDHFLGFHRLWAVPGNAKTAMRGKWLRTPGRALLTAVTKALGRVEIIAEDLGLMTPEAAALRDSFGYPGMRLVQFAFGDDQGARYHQPHTFPYRCVVYTGTHDNETVEGFFKHVRSDHRRGVKRDGLTEWTRFVRYTNSDGRAVHWDLVRLCYLSPADTAVIPMQDILGLNNRGRMNNPGVPLGNWGWRMKPGALTETLAQRLHTLARTFDRVRIVPPAAKRRRRR